MSDSPTMHHVAWINELRDGVPKRVEADGTPVLLIRRGNEVRAFQADCPHAGAPLEQGAVCRGRLVCPWHKGTFDADTGALLEPPALLGLKRYAVKLYGDDVAVSCEAREPQPAVSVRDGSSRAGDTFAIVGGGAAGAAACASLREFGFAGRLVLIDAETIEPYDRTALSKFVPAGELSPGEVYPLLPADFLDRHHVKRIRARITKLDANTREITVDGSISLNYEAALFAPGSVPKAPGIYGLHEPAVRERVVLLRGLDDARRLDRLAAAGGHAVVIGSSFIGLEVASALRKRGLQATVISPDETPFAAQFGDEIGAHFRALHELNGTAFRMRSHVGAIKAGHPLRVEFDDGSGLNCDFVIVGTGVAPATECLEGVKRNDDGGIDVDASMQAAEALYAAGDVAAFEPAPGSARIRIEHWRVAQQQARAAARAMLGLEAAQPWVPYFWTYHYGKRFDYLGHARSGDWDRLVTTGSLDGDDFVTLFARDERVLAALACNRDEACARLAEAMRDPLSLDEAQRLIDYA